MQKKPAIIIAVLCVISLGLGYWVGLPKEGSTPPLPPPPGPKVPVPPVKVLPANGELIADPVLRKELAKILKIEESKITPKNLAKLTKLSLSRKGIRSIQGLEHCTTLKSLDLRFNQIEDLSPIVKLDKLEGLALAVNPFKVVPDLSALKKVKDLNFYQCRSLRDISGLKGMTWLETLLLERVGLKDISPVVGLVNLKSLDLRFNQIEDLSPIVNMGKLENLNVDNNLIQKVPDLSKLIYITLLSFQNNHLRDISGLKAMGGLETLNITNNPMLSDLAPLSGLKRLKSL